MKDIEIGPIRPPSESNSLLIRVTRGCHWNKCYFCGLYKSMQFSMRPIDETIEDIRQQAQFYQGKKINSCFLQDGDALVLKTDYLLRILDAINQYFPDIQYITSYARADSITRKTPAELKILRQAGLNHLYCGMETGSAQILRLINKGFDSDTVVRSGCMAKDADMILSEFILLGIGGKELSEENAIQTAKALNVIQPDFIRVHATGIKPEGSSALDTSALTGESMPREVEPGMEVISGCINQTGILTIQTTKEFGESTVAKILDLVENASDKKGKTENFITRFARYYTPAVVFAALALAVLPPLITGQAFGVWIYRALTFLVISCPCALVISIPLSFFGGIGGASKIGVLVKGSNYLESLAHAEVVVFDKTGTLTKGSFVVSEIHPNGMKEEKLLELAAYAEDYSNHPISLSIKKAYGKKIDNSRISNVQEIAGHGVQAVIDGKSVLAGNAKLMEKEHIKYKPSVSIGTVVYLACDGKYAGCIVIEDEVKEDAPAAIKLLKSSGIRKTVMLTGDADAVGQKVAGRLGLDQAYTELLPADKVDRVEDLLKQKSEKGKLVFVGDGINDAPVLARADVGIAMGGLGSDAAIEAADVVLMTDEPSKIAAVMKIARKTIGIANQNIVFALGVKFLVLVLGALGYANMWAAVFADVGVSVIAILNAIRAMRVKQPNMTA